MEMCWRREERGAPAKTEGGMLLVERDVRRCLCSGFMFIFPSLRRESSRKKKIWIVQSGCREGERENEEERTGDTKGGNLPHVLSGLKDAAGRGCLQSECTLESRAGVRGVS